MSEQEPGPSQNPYGQPANPYGQSPTPNPYGQAYGGPPQPAYGASSPMGSPGGGRPGTVTAAAWITIVLSGLSAVLFGVVTLLFLVARDTIVNELEAMPEFQDTDVDPGSIVGVLVAVMLLLGLWSVISAVLGVFVLRRSNVARILLVISSAVVAIGSILSITSGLSIVWLIAAIAVIVLLFVGGAGAWFSGTSDQTGAGGYPGGGTYGGDPYGSSPYGTQPGTQPGNPGQPGGYGEQPYGGTPPQQGGADYPPSDYPGR